MPIDPPRSSGPLAPGVSGGDGVGGCTCGEPQAPGRPDERGRLHSLPSGHRASRKPPILGPQGVLHYRVRPAGSGANVNWLNELARCGRGIYHERRLKLWPELVEMARAVEKWKLADDDWGRGSPLSVPSFALDGVREAAIALKAKVESL